MVDIRKCKMGCIEICTFFFCGILVIENNVIALAI